MGRFERCESVVEVLYRIVLVVLAPHGTPPAHRMGPFPLPRHWQETSARLLAERDAAAAAREEAHEQLAEAPT